MPKNLQLDQELSLGGMISYYCMPITISKTLEKITLPEPFTSFSFKILFTFLISNALKLIVPFSLQYLYLNANPNNVIYPTLYFIAIIVTNYYFELKSQKVIFEHKLKIKKILCQRVIKTAFRKPYEQFQKSKQQQSKSSWSKIEANINIFVNNYYSSYITIVFQTLKAIFIVCYLFYKLSWITFVGLFIGGFVTQFIRFISKKIENANFQKLKSTEQKTKILTQYFSRIVDYQMSWLDGFIGDRIQKLQNNIQKNLKKSKLLDAWCVGFWQFTQICISSIMLCLYYFYYAPQVNQTQSSQNQLLTKVQPATIIYLFQMLTFPMNAISWNIAGLSNAERALNELAQGERNAKIEQKKQKMISKYDYGIQIIQIQKVLKPGKFYSLSSQDVHVFKKLALSLSSQTKSTSYAEQNGFMLSTVLQSLFLWPSQLLDSDYVKRNIKNVTKVLKLAICQQIPLSNLVSTFSGGQKMRISLARAFLNGKYIIIDSELVSLDKTTRSKVFKNIREYLTVNVDTVVIIKGKKDDQDIKSNVNQFIHVEPKFSRVYFQPNNNLKTNMKKLIAQKEFEEASRLQQKILDQVVKLSAQKTFYSPRTTAKSQPSLQQSKRFSKKQQIPKKMAKKLFLTLKTLQFYFQSRIYHLLFLLSLIAMYSVGNYYYYYVNLKRSEDTNSYAWTILQITVVYVICIIGRSYFFAVANLRESDRICNFTNKLVVYNHINFYDRYQLVQHQLQQQIESSEIEHENNPQKLQKQKEKELNTEKLVYISTSDQNVLSNNFPFSTNILWNNIATVIGSLVMVFIQVPSMIIFAILFLMMVRKIQKYYRQASQQLALSSKQNQIHLMKSVNYIEQGGLYFRIYNRVNQYKSIFDSQLQKIISNQNQQLNLSIWVQSNFRFNMIVFLILSVFLFCFDFQCFFYNLCQAQSKSAKLSVMVRYILLLADYVFYFTRSFSECRGQALSIERIRRIMENTSAVKGSFQRKQRSNHKIEGLLKALKQSESTLNRQYINLFNFNYQYNKKGPLILQDISINIKTGDRITLKGKTGAGKTTLFKILMGLYPETYYPENSMHLISFSSQHPLKMGNTSVLQKLDPYKILQLVPQHIKSKVMQKVRKILDKAQKNIAEISYEQQVQINNLRAYLYGFKGLAIYDEPRLVIGESNTHMIVTHHGKFSSTTEWKLQKGKLYQISIKQN